ncbi:DUF488 family protein [Lactobacillus sp. PV037]|uniref:DUF488 domain-containing protein n=1 Tax=unclassified Lactobacillus TaxID=2620435 RepID=UPI00223EEEA9|nr:MULTISPECIES: DUF488 family protein [unclassified Lactobacillus]QNQ81698.1 DUF488 family protein [Lactobacillus sp. PV012]QNQ84255.1 DUF488 family protein [Lactobacillus sp. PV037]
MSEIKVVRIYDKNQPSGYRILVDRLWPRGMSKVRAKLDLWDKEIAPSSELRKWFNHQDERWEEFYKKYKLELKKNPHFQEFTELVTEKLAAGDVLFLYGAKNLKHNQAIALKKIILENKVNDDD